MSALLIRKLQAVNHCLQQRNPEEALRLTEDLLQKVPRNAELLTYRGISLLMLGRLEGAINTLLTAVELSPNSVMALEHLGLSLLHVGRLFEAENFLKRACLQKEAPASVWFRLGLSILHQGRASEAVDPLLKALTISPEVADIQMAWGRVMTLIGKHEQAIAAFEEALRIEATLTDAIFNIGVVHMENGASEKAKAAFSKVLSIDPRNADAMVNLGVLAEQIEDFFAAKNWYEQAVLISPQNSIAFCNLGALELRSGNAVKAIARFRTALEFSPTLNTALEGAAQACRALRRFPEAIKYLQHLTTLEPNFSKHHVDLADCQLQMGFIESAESSAIQAIHLEPSLALAWGLRAKIKILMGDTAQAINILESGLHFTDDCGLLGMLSQRLRHICDWDRASLYWEQLKPRLLSGEDAGSPFPLLCEDLTSAEICHYTEQWAKRNLVPPSDFPRKSQTKKEGRLRVGYFSSDFQEHPAAYLITEVLETHDRSAFEIFAYSYGPKNTGAIRKRIQNAVEHFIDIAWDPDDEVVKKIVSDEIDILIDLKGLTVGDRLSVMACRPAPVQVSWLGYPGTTGTKFIDYLFADEYIVRENEHFFYSEKILLLPNCYQPIDRKRIIDSPRPREFYGLPLNGPILCCFNQTFKITREIFSIWMEVLLEIPGAVLWLVDDNPESTKNLRQAATKASVDPKRLIFAERVKLSEHLARYFVADLAVDTFPYTSHTTASDALWCGCPLLSLTGDTFAGRVSGSILTAVGMPDMICKSTYEYKSRLISLLSNQGQLNELRCRISDEKTKSMFFNTEKFTRELEKLLLKISPRNGALNL